MKALQLLSEACRLCAWSGKARNLLRAYIEIDGLKYSDKGVSRLGHKSAHAFFVRKPTRAHIAYCTPVPLSTPSRHFDVNCYAQHSSRLLASSDSPLVVVVSPSVSPCPFSLKQRTGKAVFALEEHRTPAAHILPLRRATSAETLAWFASAIVLFPCLSHTYPICQLNGKTYVCVLDWALPRCFVSIFAA